MRRFDEAFIGSNTDADTVRWRDCDGRRGWFSLSGEIGCGIGFLRMDAGVIDRRQLRSAGRIDNSTE